MNLKIVKALILILLPLFGNAQSTFYIKAVLDSSIKVKYAYLALPKDLSSLQDTGKFLITPFHNGIAEFKGTLDLGEDILKTGYIFVDDRSNITMSETISKIRERIWSLKSKNIVIEDVTFRVINVDSVKTSKILEGGELTKQLDEYYKILNDGNEISFYQKYSDSPMSLFQLQYVVKMYELPLRASMESEGIDPRVYYKLLSDRLKSTKYARDLNSRISRLFDK
ncbi:hypothetical protein ACJVDH_16525 [Pedobacter sp. AW1-32]|uniref:hypothetical protein n=1 Tax=Pedobacter sp. AW1-32 TaxID=3383026 RepID=UPI003FEDD86A